MLTETSQITSGLDEVVKKLRTNWFGTLSSLLLLSEKEWDTMQLPLGACVYPHVS
jgi:hypothetical protein